MQCTQWNGIFINGTNFDVSGLRVAGMGVVVIVTHGVDSFILKKLKGLNAEEKQEKYKNIIIPIRCPLQCGYMYVIYYKLYTYRDA